MAKSSRAGQHVALLRGINVGGKNKLPMKVLVPLVEAAGGQQVRTYIQSGNVVYRATAAVARTMATMLAEAIERECGLTVPVVARTAKELSAALADNPFLAEGADEKTLHVGFLAKRPTKAAAAALDPDRSPGDRFFLRGRELLLHFPNGVARTKLTSAYLDRTLGTTVTVRNWRTVNKVAALLSG